MGARARLKTALRYLPLLLAPPLAVCGGAATGTRVVTVAATTTLEDSGLLAELIGSFRAAHPDIPVRMMTGGTGTMLALGRRGDVDLLLTHDPEGEAAFVASGHGTVRREVMHNDFVIAGPAGDPAGIAGSTDAPEALRRIAAARAPFVSRGDDSGTHRMERRLWSAAGFDPAVERRVNDRDRWYIEAGIGMGDALRLAGERRAYIMTDRATYLTLRDGLDLVVLVQGDARLLNRYGIIRVKSARNAAGSDLFMDWITSPDGQAVIGGFGRDRFGVSLFTPATRRE